MKRLARIFIGVACFVLLAAVIAAQVTHTAFASYLEPVAIFGVFVVGALMSDLRSPLSDCKTLRFTNDTAGDLVSGAYVLRNETFGFLLEDTPDTEDGMLVIETGSQGIVLDKAAVAVAPGEDAFWDTGNDNVTNDGTGQLQNIGYFAEAAAGGVARVRVVLEQGRGLGPA